MVASGGLNRLKVQPAGAAHPTAPAGPTTSSTGSKHESCATGWFTNTWIKWISSNITSNWHGITFSFSCQAGPRAGISDPQSGILTHWGINSVTPPMSDLQQALADAKIAIIGLGYVGLPLALAFGQLRPTLGFDIDQARRGTAARS